MGKMSHRALAGDSPMVQREIAAPAEFGFAGSVERTVLTKAVRAFFEAFRQSPVATIIADSPRSLPEKPVPT
jgi:hypothetical protein